MSSYNNIQSSKISFYGIFLSSIIGNIVATILLSLFVYREYKSNGIKSWYLWLAGVFACVHLVLAVLSFVLFMLK